MRLELIIQYTSGHNSFSRHLIYYKRDEQMDLTCRLCYQPNTMEDSKHIWSTCDSQTIKMARKWAIAQCRLKIRKAPCSEVWVWLANLLNNFTNFIWSQNELSQFIWNESVMMLLEDYKPLQGKNQKWDNPYSWRQMYRL